MLTKDLIRYRQRQGLISPQFIDPDEATIQATAAALVAVFQDAVGLSREELAAETQAIIDAREGETAVGRGLEKLLLDRTSFETPSDEASPAFRDQVFQTGSKILAETQVQTFEDYRDRLESALALPIDDLRARLYADLPAFHPVLAFKPISPEQLLHHYNCAQVQWLLLHCRKLEIRLPAKRTASLRQLFKYLRFNQLLATIQKVDGNTYLIDISGPLSMFYQTKRYGLNLAHFFPALLHQSSWQLRAEIAIGKKQAAVLLLDDSAGIRPGSERFHAFIPEEVGNLQRGFEQKAPGWQIKPNPDFLAFAGERYCFPDFSLVHESGYSVAMELFHPWHDFQLADRLAQVASLSPPPLILGVARKLAGRRAIAEKLADSAYFHDFGFQFRDLPVTAQVLPILERLLALNG